LQVLGSSYFFSGWVWESQEVTDRPSKGVAAPSDQEITGEVTGSCNMLGEASHQCMSFYQSIIS
jgi:hypothetical protein